MADLLDTYIDAFLAQGNTAFELWRGANLDVGSSNTLGGRIDRLDVRPHGGYAAWLFALRPNPRKWRGRLAMPLLQHEVASLLGASTDDVTVGFYWVEIDEYDDHRYSRDEIDRALTEMRVISARIASMSPPAL